MLRTNITNKNILIKFIKYRHYERIKENTLMNIINNLSLIWENDKRCQIFYLNAMCIVVHTKSLKKNYEKYQPASSYYKCEQTLSWTLFPNNDIYIYQVISDYIRENIVKWCQQQYTDVLWIKKKRRVQHYWNWCSTILKILYKILKGF